MTGLRKEAPRDNEGQYLELDFARAELGKHVLEFALLHALGEVAHEQTHPK